MFELWEESGSGQTRVNWDYFAEIPGFARLRPARPLEASALYLLLQHYLEQLPGAMKEEQLSDGSTVRRCIYTPHSLRATTATLLLDGNVDIAKVKDLLGHRHITTTQIYDKRRRSTSESASHLLAI
jgi:site-specific recombinase XerD